MVIDNNVFYSVLTSNLSLSNCLVFLSVRILLNLPDKESLRFSV